MPSFEFDTNNRYIFTRFNFHLWKNCREELQSQCEKYILHDRIIIENQHVLFFIPRDPFVIEYDGKPIQVEYSVMRKPAESEGLIMRFEQFQIHSSDHQHILDFVNMINELVIPEADQMEIAKYIWRADDRRWGYSQNVMKRK